MWRWGWGTRGLLWRFKRAVGRGAFGRIFGLSSLVFFLSLFFIILVIGLQKAWHFFSHAIQLVLSSCLLGSPFLYIIGVFFFLFRLLV